MALTKRPTVEVVIINYKRPSNIPFILDRFRKQTYYCTITLVDSGRDLTPEVYKLADRVYTLNENYSAYNRYIPVGNYRHDFTYFHDDDMLPGLNVIRHFLTHALQRPDGVLFGQQGRTNFDAYDSRNIWGVPDSFTPVSMVVRGYFLRTRYLYTLLKFSRYIKHWISEDDILLAWALRTYTSKLIYLTPRPQDISERMNEQELPSPYSCSGRIGHYDIRDTFWRECCSLSQEIQRRRHKKIQRLKIGKF